MDCKEKFKNSSYYRQLDNDIHHWSRCVGHALDNYGVDMENELKEALESLRGAMEEVLECIK